MKTKTFAANAAPGERGHRGAEGNTPSLMARGSLDIVRQLQQICAQLECRNTSSYILSIAIGGSVGRGEYDSSSDLDVFVTVSREADLSHAGKIVGSLARQLGKVLLWRGPIYVKDFGLSHTTIYFDGMVIQWNVSTLRSEQSVMSGSKKLILLDRGGYYAKSCRIWRKTLPDLPAIERSAYSLFWLRVSGLVQALERGDLWSALSHLTDMREQMILLCRCVRAILPPGVMVAKPSKRFEQQCGKRLAKSFAATLAGYDKDDIVRAASYSIKRVLRLVGKSELKAISPSAATAGRVLARLANKRFKALSYEGTSNGN